MAPKCQNLEGLYITKIVTFKDCGIYPVFVKIRQDCKELTPWATTMNTNAEYFHHYRSVGSSAHAIY